MCRVNTESQRVRGGGGGGEEEDEEERISSERERLVWGRGLRTRAGSKWAVSRGF